MKGANMSSGHLGFQNRLTALGSQRAHGHSVLLWQRALDQPLPFSRIGDSDVADLLDIYLLAIA